MFTIISVAKSIIFTSFPIYNHSISSYCLIALGKTTITVLNTNRERGHSCLVPNLLRMLWAFLHLL